MSLTRLLVVLTLMITSLNGGAEPVPSHTPVEVPAAALEGMEEVTPSEVKKIRKDFRRAQKEQSKTVENELKRARKEGRFVRKQRRQQWEREQRDERRKFFEKNVKGADRRAYVKDFIERRKKMNDLLKEEDRLEREQQAARRKALEEEQLARRQELEGFLKSKRRPPDAIWPLN